MLHEHRRGEEPRYWEDVSLEDALQPVVKGPIDTIAMTSYYAGSIGSEGYKACELRWSQWRAARETPDLLPNNHDISYLSEFVLPSAGHQVDKVAHAVGMPAAYDNGAMRVGWTAHLVTNWMGDAGSFGVCQLVSGARTAWVIRPGLAGTSSVSFVMLAGSTPWRSRSLEQIRTAP